MDLITSASNPLIKQARALQKKKARLESKTFLVEGIYHVAEAIQAGWDVDVVLYAPDLLTSPFAKDLLDGVAHIKLQPISAHLLESLAGKENPQGILAVVKQKEFKFDDVKNVQRAVALVSPQDPGNVGTILRTIDAINIDALFLLEGGVELYHPTVIRASMGTIFWKPIIQASFTEFVAWTKQKNIQLIGTSAKADVSYQSLIPQIPWALILGNEQKGLTKEQVDVCDVTVSIPMSGRVSSLNLSVAAGVLLYGLRK
ncbi:MAG: tRNA/rRNA methyltransferase SpoU [Chloroflexi bacterium OLB14]|nr:MAG: tRNA/rRNA methyltransferase SpoU [Chloroflexi bacterium OLB14]